MNAANDNAPIKERRRAPRQRALLEAKLVYGPGARTVSCAVRSVSRGGVAVRLPAGQAAALGDVQLILVSQGLIHAGRAVWARDGDAGVAITASYDVDGPLPAELRHARRLWAELSRP